MFALLAALADDDGRPISGGVHASDRELRSMVEQARDGDRLAFAQLYDMYFPRLYRYALARTRSVADAEDVACETMIAAWSALPRFTWRGAPFAAWLFTIAQRQIALQARRSARHQDRAGANAPRWPDDTAADDHAPEVDERMAIRACISGLPDDQRQVVELRFYGELTSDEIAHALGKTSGAVRQLQLRALKRLRSELTAQGAAA